MNYIEVDTNIINDNINNIIKARNDYKYYIAVVKGNAYGHGYELVKYIINKNINYYAVATYEEAIKVRNFTDLPILILQPIDLKYIDSAIKNNFSITITSFNFYKNLINTKFNGILNIHVKINTGMNRLGLDKKEELEAIYNDLIINNKYNINFEGLYSHFATLGIVDDEWDKQVNKFKSFISNIDYNKIKMIHFYSSNSLSIHPKLEFCNTARFGQLMFGNYFNNINTNGFINKLKEIKRNYIRNKLYLSKLNDNFYIDVKKAFSLYSEIQEIKVINKGDKVGYDLSYIATDDKEYIAMIPIGYADGFNNYFENKYVLINNKKYLIIGHINMCMTLIKVDKDISICDKVLLLGNKLKYDNLNILTGLKNDIKKIYK